MRIGGIDMNIDNITKEKIKKAIANLDTMRLNVESGEQYVSINMALVALEKQIKRKPIRNKLVCDVGTCYERTATFYVCPYCGNRVEVDDNEGCWTEYYPTCECGQRIDWEGIIDGYNIKWNENWKETAKE